MWVGGVRDEGYFSPLDFAVPHQQFLVSVGGLLSIFWLLFTHTHTNTHKRARTHAHTHTHTHTQTHIHAGGTAYDVFFFLLLLNFLVTHWWLLLTLLTLLTMTNRKQRPVKRDEDVEDVFACECVCVLV